MLTATQIAAFVGVGLAGAAYIPQIWHLVRAHCSAGISRFAFCLWLGASLLITTHAIATQATAFIVLGGVQIAATTVILLFATKYASSYCGSHDPGTIDPGAEMKLGVLGEAPAWRLGERTANRDSAPDALPGAARRRGALAP